MKKLVPCPYCKTTEDVSYDRNGIPVYLDVIEEEKFGTYYALCTNCFIRGPQKRTENESRTAWNKAFGK